MAKIIEKVGARYGRWTVLGPAKNAADHRVCWLCRCDCGVERAVRGKELRKGGSTSCGCTKLVGVVQHGHRHTPIYEVWKSMRARCSNPKDKRYADYGGRGITVCERWRTFKHFLADVGERPTGMSIDRIDNSCGYEPGNVRWATLTEQSRNTRHNVVLEFHGKQRCVTEWAERIGISADALFRRLYRGWSVERALTTPLLRRHQSTVGPRPIARAC